MKERPKNKQNLKVKAWQNIKKQETQHLVMSIRNKHFIFIYLLRPITFVPLNKCFSSKNVFVQANKLQLKVCTLFYSKLIVVVYLRTKK